MCVWKTLNDVIMFIVKSWSFDSHTRQSIDTSTAATLLVTVPLITQGGWLRGNKD